MKIKKSVYSFQLESMIKIKRVYEKPTKEDGFRILVDRLWPRGLTKEKAKIDLWLKEIAPSNELRKWFAHDLKKWSEFKKKYIVELEKKKDLLQQIKKLEKEKKTITLVYAAKSEKYNNTVVLKEILQAST